MNKFESPMFVEIKGQIERITYHNEENNYTVAQIKVPGKNNLITVVGNLFSVNPGEVLKLCGEWHTHPQYGRRFSY